MYYMSAADIHPVSSRCHCLRLLQPGSQPPILHYLTRSVECNVTVLDLRMLKSAGHVGCIWNITHMCEFSTFRFLFLSSKFRQSDCIIRKRQERAIPRSAPRFHAITFRFIVRVSWRPKWNQDLAQWHGHFIFFSLLHNNCTLWYTPAATTPSRRKCLKPEPICERERRSPVALSVFRLSISGQ